MLFSLDELLDKGRHCWWSEKESQFGFDFLVCSPVVFSHEDRGFDDKGEGSFEEGGAGGQLGEDFGSESVDDSGFAEDGDVFFGGAIDSFGGGAVLF